MPRIYHNVIQYEIRPPDLPRPLVYVNGCFDWIHYGHIWMLKWARGQGRSLVVGLNSDTSVRLLKGPDRPLIPEWDRARTLISLEAVDRVVIFDTPRCDRLMCLVSPDVYVKGGDWSLANIDPSELQALRQCNTSIVFLPRHGGLSTSGLLQTANRL